jgi:hypothetical protein
MFWNQFSAINMGGLILQYIIPVITTGYGQLDLVMFFLAAVALIHR